MPYQRRTAGIIQLGAAAAALVLSAAGADGQTDPLTLERALALAREHSLVLSASAADVQRAKGRQRAVRALYGPQLRSDAFYLRFEDPPSLALAPGASFSPIATNGYLLQIGVLQPLYTGGRVGAAVQAAEWAGRAASAASQQAEVEVTAAVAHAFDAALLGEELLEVAEEAVRVLRSAVEVAMVQYETGVVARLDVLRAQTRLTAAEQEARAAAAAAVRARERLALAIGLDPARAPQPAGVLRPADVPFGPADAAPLAARARQMRPDVRALGAAVEAAAAQERGARSALRPNLSLYAAGLAARPELLTGEERLSTDLVAGLMLSWPLFDFGRAGGEADAARAEATRLEAEARGLADAAVAEVRAALRDLERGQLDIAGSLENVTRSERALEIARDRYGAGVGIQLEVLDAQSELSRARASVLRTIHDHRSAAIELRRAIGLPADAALPALDEEP